MGGAGRPADRRTLADRRGDGRADDRHGHGGRRKRRPNLDAHLRAPHGFPQVIHSAKRFSGPTGLEEYVGFGISMALKVSVGHDALVFTSAGYAVRLGRLRLTLPDWLTPGELTVIHTDLGCGLFRFTLEIVHPRFGRLLRQSAVFREAAP